jgi:hypothetical protein
MCFPEYPMDTCHHATPKALLHATEGIKAQKQKLVSGNKAHQG